MNNTILLGLIYLGMFAVYCILIIATDEGTPQRPSEARKDQIRRMYYADIIDHEEFERRMDALYNIKKVMK
jgi:hypothetical protein